MRRIVLPGGSGYLGQAIGQALVARGDDVVALSRSKSRSANGIRFVHWDGVTLGDWVEEIDGAHAIVHLTGQRVDTRATKKNIDELISSRVGPVIAVGEAVRAVANPPAIWVQSSSLAIYGDTGDTLIEEDHIPSGIGPREMVTVCLAWEHAFAATAATIDRKVVLRTGIGLGGPSDPATRKLAMLVKLGLGGPVGDGRQWISWIDLRDLIRIFLRAIDEPTMTGVYHATCPEPATNATVMRVFRSQLNRGFGLSSPKPLVHLGAPLLGSSASLGLSGRRAIPRRLLDEGFIFEHTDLNDSVAYALTQI